MKRLVVLAIFAVALAAPTAAVPATKMCPDVGPPDPWQLHIGITEADFCHDLIVGETPG